MYGIIADGASACYNVGDRIVGPDRLEAPFCSYYPHMGTVNPDDPDRGNAGCFKFDKDAVSQAMIKADLPERGTSEGRFA